jgi:hypothetical protein
MPSEQQFASKTNYMIWERRHRWSMSRIRGGCAASGIEKPRQWIAASQP